MPYPNTLVNLCLCACFTGFGICVSVFLFTVFGYTVDHARAFAWLGAGISATACAVQLFTGGPIWNG